MKTKSPNGERTMACSRCNKPRDGAHKSYCKACNAEYCREQRAQNPEKFNARQRAYEASLDPEFKRSRRKNFKLKYAYGLTLEDFNSLVAEQNGCCAICWKEFDLVNDPKNAHVDHCHETNSVRGILCSKCNTGVGLFNDNPTTLVQAANYLLKNLEVK